MNFTAVFISLWMNVPVLLLLAKVQHSYSHNADATFPHVVPARLQFFEYETVFVKCEGFFTDLTEWRVMRRIKGTDTVCYTEWDRTGPCTITTVYSVDSGEYWCEAGGKKSNTVSIVVTEDSVILESPVHPVTEGDAVTLSCRNKKRSNFTADFYKDGLLIKKSSTGNMTILRVSKSDEGLYKCSISGVGESPESRMAVRAGSVVLQSPGLPVVEGEAVTLLCRNNKTSNSTTDFYKDGVLIRSNSTPNMTINSVSTSDEGFYKCNIFDVGESAEIWLTVRETIFPVRYSTRVSALLWMIVTFLLVSLLLLLVVGLHYMKLKGASTSSPSITTRSLVQTETSEADLHLATYAVIKNPRMTKETGVGGPQPATYAVIIDPGEKNEDEFLTTQLYYTLSMAAPGESSSTAEPVPSSSPGSFYK